MDSPKNDSKAFSKNSEKRESNSNPNEKIKPGYHEHDRRDRDRDRDSNRYRERYRSSSRSRDRGSGRDRQRDDYRDRDRDRDRDRGWNRGSDRLRDRSRNRRSRSRSQNRSPFRRHSRTYREDLDSRRRRYDSDDLEPGFLNANNEKNESTIGSVTSTKEPNIVENKKVPVSVEDLKNLKLAKEENEKPVFLSKEERQKLAIEKRQREVALQRESRQNERNGMQNATNATLNSNGSHRRDKDSRNRDGYRKYRETSGEYDSNRNRSQTRDRDRDRQSIQEKKQKEMETKAIRERYIGSTKEKRKVRKMNEKNFVFDWDAKEDTSQDFNELYSNRHEPQFFGRGHIAGFDIKEQMAKKSQFYQDLLSQRRTKEESNRLRDFESKVRRKEELVKWDDRHWSEKSLNEMKERDWRIFKEDFNISCKGGGIPNPIRSWNESGLPKNILDVIEKIGYEKPSPIQRQAIPIGLQNRDIIGIAETGSGKTASFLIPMLVYISSLPKIDDKNKGDGPYAIILAPTRELAQQIEQETLKFSKLLQFTCVSIVGGRSIDEQAFSLRNGAEIVIATPGRLRDVIDRRILVLNQTTYVVMDEADRMVDMGFEEDVNYILDALPSTHLKPDSQDAEDSAKMLQSQSGSALRYRQTTMFSATMPSAVERLARKYLRRPAIVTIGTAGQAVDTVVQRVEFITSTEKKRIRLMEIISVDYKPPIIIFVNLKKSADFLFKSLSRDHECVVLHGGKSQDQREAALSKLKSGEADVLIATDVAGRGIDVKDVSLVINFDMAKSIEDYTHRIGRTGRAGKHGEAITFLTNDDADVMYDLRKMMEKSPLSKPPVELIQHEASQAPPGVTRTKRRFEETVFKE